MLAGEVETTRYPRNPLDMLAQQIVAMVAMDRDRSSELYATVRGAPRRSTNCRGIVSKGCSTCSRAGTRRTNSPSCGRGSPGIGSRATSPPRKAAQRLAVLNGGTIPDRGLYGVYLASADGAWAARRRA